MAATITTYNHSKEPLARINRYATHGVTSRAPRRFRHPRSAPRCAELPEVVGGHPDLVLPLELQPLGVETRISRAPWVEALLVAPWVEWLRDVKGAQ